MNEKKCRNINIYILICFCLSIGITFSIYPFIGLADGFSRWRFALEIVENGKITSDNLLSPILPYFQAFTYKLTGSFGLYTFIQCFLFYLACGLIFEVLINQEVAIKNRIKIPLWIIISCMYLVIPTVLIFPAMLTDSAPVFILIAILYYIWSKSFHIALKISMEMALVVLCVGIRINSVVLFMFVVLYFLIFFLFEKNKRHLLSATVILLACILGMILPSKLNPVSHNASTLGMVWELTEIASDNDNKEIIEELSKYGDVEKALDRIGEPYLNSIVWDNNPPFSAYDISGIYSKDITKLYLRTIINYPEQFIRNKLHSISNSNSNSLGLSNKLISSGRGIHYLDENTKRFGAVESNQQIDIRNAFIKCTDFFGFLTLKPIILIVFCFILNIVLSFVHYRACWRLFGISCGYYSSFLVNTQAYEYRYFAPSFYLLLICAFYLVIQLFILIKPYK